MVVFRSLLCGLATEPHPFGLSGSKPCADRGAYVGKGREPGVARRRVTFFRFAERKSPKKGRPPVCDPFAVRRGKPASGRLRGAPQNSLRAGALRSNNCGESVHDARRSDSHGESEHEARALRRACHPTTAPPQAQPAGVGQPNSRTVNTGHRCARPRGRGAQRLRHSGRAQ